VHFSATEEILKGIEKEKDLMTSLGGGVTSDWIPYGIM
jgi:hypothetical protein